MNKILITYFSASGVTKEKGHELATLLGAQEEEIIPEEKYTSLDLDWRNKKSRSSLEMMDETSRPKMVPFKSNLDDFDTIFIGFPIWWGVEPRIIDTFLDNYNLEGKKIIVFGTSGGSPINYSLAHLKEKYPNLVFKKAVLLNFKLDKDEVLDLIKD